MMKLHKIAILTVICMTIIFQNNVAFAALAINQEALAAVAYENAVVKEANLLINFYDIGMRLVGPNPVSGYSVIKGMSHQNRFDRIFAKLESRKKKIQTKETELWEDMLGANEKAAINYLYNSLAEAGRIMWKDWPDIPLPGGKKDEYFSGKPASLSFIVPAISGVVIGSPSNFDKDMRKYLISSRMFYPVLTFEIPIPEHILKNRLKEMILTNICAGVPGSKISEDYLIITIFPELDSMHDLVVSTLNSLKEAQEEEVNKNKSKNSNMPTMSNFQ